jgi:hypothetical protein
MGNNGNGNNNLTLTVAEQRPWWERGPAVFALLCSINALALMWAILGESVSQWAWIAVVVLTGLAFMSSVTRDTAK